MACPLHLTVPWWCHVAGCLRCGSRRVWRTRQRRSSSRCARSQRPYKAEGRTWRSGGSADAVPLFIPPVLTRGHGCHTWQVGRRRPGCSQAAAHGAATGDEHVPYFQIVTADHHLLSPPIPSQCLLRHPRRCRTCARRTCVFCRACRTRLPHPLCLSLPLSASLHLSLPLCLSASLPLSLCLSLCTPLCLSLSPRMMISP